MCDIFSFSNDIFHLIISNLDNQVGFLVPWECCHFMARNGNFSQLTGYLSLFFLITCSPFYFMSSSNYVHWRPPSSVRTGTTSCCLGFCSVVAEGRGFCPFLLKKTPVPLQGSKSLTLHVKQDSVPCLRKLQSTSSYLSEGKRDPRIWIMVQDYSKLRLIVLNSSLPKARKWYHINS